MSASGVSLFAAYAGATIAVAISIILSVMLFKSIAAEEDLLMQCIFGGLAFVFEVAKFIAITHFILSLQRKSGAGLLSSSFIYIVMTAVSILGSLGGLQSNTLNYESAQQKVETKKEALLIERNQLVAVMNQNNNAVDEYINRAMIKNGGNNKQAENQKALTQLKEVQAKLDALEAPANSNIGAVMVALAKMLQVDDQKKVEVWVFVLFSILLDLSATYFLGIIKNESIRKQLAKHLNTESDTSNQQPEKNQTISQSDTFSEDEEEGREQLEVTVETTHQAQTDDSSYQLTELKTTKANVDNNVLSFEDFEARVNYYFQQIKSYIQTMDEEGKPCLSKRAATNEFKIGQTVADHVYQKLIDEGIIYQTPKKTYYRAKAA